MLRAQELDHAKAALAAARSTSDRLKSDVTSVSEERDGLVDKLESTQQELTVTQDSLSEALARSAAVTARAREVRIQETTLRRRSVELDEREDAVASREGSVSTREEALKSYDVGHPLLDCIMDDGTWVVGRDIEPGTWSTFADDTGCTWSTSDGRSGAGDGSYCSMKVKLDVGQTFTVHGCLMWDTY